MTTKLKIIEASQELFMANGIKSVTMDDVAQNIGMSKRTIYENFENKRSLVMACIDYIHDMKMRDEDEMVSKANNVIEELISTLQCTKTTREREKQIALELRKFYPDIFKAQYQKRYDEMSARLRERLQRGINQGIIRPDTNIRLSVYVIFETIYSLISRTNRMLDTNIDIEEAFRYVFISFFRGIATTKGIELMDKMIK